MVDVAGLARLQDAHRYGATMAYDEGLAERIREALGDEATEEKKMFGGVAWMWRGNMLVGIVGDDLMARVGPEQQEAALEKKGARPMDFTGKPMKGYLYVAPNGIEEDAQLVEWIDMAKRFVATLPEK